MKLIIFYPDTTIPPLTDQRPFPLLLVGGNTLLGHAINLAGERVSQVLVVMESVQSDIGDWLATHFPHLAADVVPMADLAPHLTGELLFYNGAAVTNATFAELPQSAATAVLLRDEATAAPTAFWVRDAQYLPTDSWLRLFAVASKSALDDGAVARWDAIFYYPVTDLDALFYANKRLLGVGYGSEDAVERSYAEDFTVFPPVFLHETAVVTGCVIGPYATIAAGAVLENSIVAHSIIGEGARVENQILRDSYLGPGSKSIGEAETIIMTDKVSE